MSEIAAIQKCPDFRVALFQLSFCRLQEPLEVWVGFEPHHYTDKMTLLVECVVEHE